VSYLSPLMKPKASLYAVTVAVILLIVVGTVRLIGSNSNTFFRKWAAQSDKRNPRSFWIKTNSAGKLGTANCFYQNRHRFF
jgi:hypothetical protein